MKQNNAAVTYTEVNQIIGSSSYDGTKCVTKDILSNNWIVDSSKLTGYQSNQLVKYQDISTPMELPTPSFSVPLVSNQLIDLYGGSLPIPTVNNCYFDSSNGAWFINGYKLEWVLSKKLDVSKGITFSIWLKRYSSSLGGKELSLTSDGDTSNWWTEDFGIQPYNANGTELRGLYPTVSTAFAGHCRKVTDLNWHHYVGTVSAPNNNIVVGKMYLDGVLGESGTGPITPIVNAPLTKARLSYTSSRDSFVGWYKKAKIFNSELTAAQVQLLRQE